MNIRMFGRTGIQAWAGGRGWGEEWGCPLPGCTLLGVSWEGGCQCNLQQWRLPRVISWCQESRWAGDQHLEQEWAGDTWAEPLLPLLATEEWAAETRVVWWVTWAWVAAAAAVLDLAPAATAACWGQSAWAAAADLVPAQPGHLLDQCEW